MKLFEVAVILVEGSSRAEIIVQPRAVLAIDQEAAKLQASRMVPLERDSDVPSMKVLVRPFA